jgi:hypothetical protein
VGPFNIPRIRIINDAYIRTVDDGPHPVSFVAGHRLSSVINRLPGSSTFPPDQVAGPGTKDPPGDRERPAEISLRPRHPFPLDRWRN